MQRDHSETFTSAALKIIFQYQHKLACSIYPGHIKIKIFGLIIMQKDTYNKIIPGVNEDNSAASFISLDDMNDEKNNRMK